MQATTVGEMVRSARKRAGMTQQQLAEATGILQPAIARIERGVVVPRTTTLITLLEATGHRLTVEPHSPDGSHDAETETAQTLSGRTPR